MLGQPGCVEDDVYMVDAGCADVGSTCFSRLRSIDRDDSTKHADLGE